MSKYAVMITSAINSKFGVYQGDTRLEQTLATVASVRDRIPGAKIFLLEMTGVPLTNNQKASISNAVDHLLDFTGDQNVTGLYNSTDNWDVVKNVTEVMCFGNALKALSRDTGLTTEYDRIFKMSGRYLLDERFDINYYNDYKNKHCIVIGPKKPSQFSYQITQIEAQYMSRLWSWPTQLNEEIIGFYDNALNFMYQRLAEGGYADIEHCLYKFLDPAKIINKEPLGIVGNIAPNGVPIKD
jgi:hypothetical protein